MFLCFFCGYDLGKVRQFFFHQLQQMLIVKYVIPIWRRVRVFSWLLRLLFARTGKEMTIQSKVDNCFHSKIPRLVNLTNQCGEKFEIITSSPCKRKLQQDQEKITETNKTQIKPKQKRTKLKPKQPVQTKKQRKRLSKKENNVDKQELTFTGCRGTRKESQIDWIVCRICTVKKHTLLTPQCCSLIFMSKKFS